MKIILLVTALISTSSFAIQDSDSIVHLGARTRFVVLNDFEIPANASALWTCGNKLSTTSCTNTRRSIVRWTNSCYLIVSPSKETRKLAKGSVLTVRRAFEVDSAGQVDFNSWVIKGLRCTESESGGYGHVYYPPDFKQVRVLTQGIFQIVEPTPKEISAENICR